LFDGLIGKAPFDTGLFYFFTNISEMIFLLMFKHHYICLACQPAACNNRFRKENGI